MIRGGVTIEKMVFGPWGLGRTPEDGVVFVRNVAPGDKADIRLDSRRGGVACGYPLAFSHVSPFRITPECPYAGTCGGCDWGHLDSTFSQKAKMAIYEECLTRIGRLERTGKCEFFSSPPYGYRLRAQCKVDSRQGRIGFFRRNTNTVVSIDQCALFVPSLNRGLHHFRKLVPHSKSDIHQVYLLSGKNDAVASWPVVPGLTTEEVTVEVDGYRFTLGARDFFQSNRYLLETLGTWARPSVEGEVLVDLYGGTGFFSLLLGKRFRRVLLVESSAALARRAEQNFIKNAFFTGQCVTGTAESILEDSTLLPAKVDCLVVDPPRPGLTRSVRESIARLQPGLLLYVSCNPSTQARDAGFFVNRCGYRILRRALFDCYPQTHHMECALLLGRSSN